MWNVLQTAPHCESQVCRFLSLQRIEGYAPRFPAPPRTRPGSVRDRKHRRVFPGYVFFRVPEEFAQWDVVRWAPGVRRLLQFDAGPALLSDGVVEHIRKRLLDRSINQPGTRFVRGQQVVIMSGPLRMVDALFDRELDAAARVQVLVQLLGRQLAVALDPAMLTATG